MSSNSLNRFGNYHGSLDTIVDDDGKFKGDEFFSLNLMANLMELNDGTDLEFFLEEVEEWSDLWYDIGDTDGDHTDSYEEVYKNEDDRMNHPDSEPDEFDVEEGKAVSHLGGTNYRRRKALKGRYTSERHCAQQATPEELQAHREKLSLLRKRANARRKCNKRKTVRRMATQPASRY